MKSLDTGDMKHDPVNGKLDLTFHVLYDTKAFVDVSRTLGEAADPYTKGQVFGVYPFSPSMIVDIYNLKDKVKISMGACLSYDPKKYDEVKSDIILSVVRKHITTIVKSYQVWRTCDILAGKRILIFSLRVLHSNFILRWRGKNFRKE